MHLMPELEDRNPLISSDAVGDPLRDPGRRCRTLPGEVPDRGPERCRKGRRSSRGRMAVLFLATGLLAACVSLGQPLPGETVSAGYRASGGEWNVGGDVIALVRAFERDGVVAYCGLWTTRGTIAMTEFLDEDVVAASVLHIGGSRIVQDMSGLPRAAYRADMTGTPAGCMRTKVPWRPGFAGAPARVRFPRMVIDPDDDEDGGISLIFRQTRVPWIVD